jgi:hypothetical protein
MMVIWTWRTHKTENRNCKWKTEIGKSRKQNISVFLGTQKGIEANGVSKDTESHRRSKKEQMKSVFTESNSPFVTFYGVLLNKLVEQMLGNAVERRIERIERIERTETNDINICSHLDSIKVPERFIDFAKGPT